MSSDVERIAKKYGVEQHQIEQLGEGAFGKVYGIRGKGIAIKVLKAAYGSHVQTREARQFNHPHLLKIIGCEKVSDRLYVTSELMNGNIMSLTLDERELWIVMSQITAGLKHLHSRNFIHRDIKPSNILFIVEDGKYRFVISDFGLTRSEETMGDLTRHAFNGTFGYIDDETSQKGVAKESDIYALGVTMVVLLLKQRNLTPEAMFRECNHSIPKAKSAVLNALKALYENGNCSYEMKAVIESMLKDRRNRISLEGIEKRCRDAISLPKAMVLPIRISETCYSRKSYHNSPVGIQKQHKMNGQRNSKGSVVAAASAAALLLVGVVGVGAVLLARDKKFD